MPDTELMFTRRNTKVKSFLGRKLHILHGQIAMIIKYKKGQISIRSHMLEMREEQLSVNLPELQIRVHTGENTVGLTDDYVENAAGIMIKKCSGLERIHFNLWIWNTAANGFYEHVPE